MYGQDSTSAAIRPRVVHAVAAYARRHTARTTRRLREGLPPAYTPRHRHDTDGHADEAVFLAAIAADAHVARVEGTTAAEDELLGVDALVTVRGEGEAVPIDFTTRGRGAPGGVATLRDTLRRGVVPVVLEEVPTDLAPHVAYAAFADWRGRAEAYFVASLSLAPSGAPRDASPCRR